MKAPGIELTAYAALHLGGAVYLATRLPTTAVEFQAVAAALAVCLAVEAVLLFLRFRWSPEVFVVINLLLIGWGVVRGVTDGFNGNRIALIAGAVAALFGYPTLRREVRGRATASADPCDAAKGGGGA